MRVKYVCGLYLILISVFITTVCTSAIQENDEDYDYEDIDLTEPSTTKATTPKPKKSTTSTTEIYFPDLEETPKPILNPCPEVCTCMDGTKFIDCRNRNISSIPSLMPEDALKIDLSDNHIEHIDADVFKDCLELSDLILARNQINRIDANAFTSLTNLRRLDLSSNLLFEIAPNTFTKPTALAILNLDNNPLVIPEATSLLTTTHVTELSLADCNLTAFNANTFKNLGNLELLNIRNNAFVTEETEYSIIFMPLQSLKRLIMPDIEEKAFKAICDTLKVVDVVETQTYNISCFELVSGTSFESAIVVEPVTKPPKTFEIKKTPVENTSARLTRRNESLSLTTSTISPLSSDAMNVTDTPVESSSLHSANFINQILIGTIVVSVIGLIIGIICRKDVFGVKTKMCRTNRRPNNSTEIQSNPAESVPLNKISTTN